MIATADSRINKANWMIIRKFTMINEREFPELPSKASNKCPAIILADRRMASVPGRIIFLTLSIHTINGIRIGGVPWGTRWANI